MIDRSKICLIHGGHKGAEAEFGRAASRWDVEEITLSYEGHNMERAVNVETLDDEELNKGRVGMEFVFQRMGRRFVQGRGLSRVMNSMFHVVVRSDELFAIGWIQPNKTIKGGTGWGVELAKVFGRQVHVFDQDKERWFSWLNHKWVASEPVFSHEQFSATGTRHLSEAGIRAIHDLFERSLGPVSAETATEQSR
jgi:hypothetical protein